VYKLEKIGVLHPVVSYAKRCIVSHERSVANASCKGV